MELSLKKPECSKWKVWIGRECEGNEDFGHVTLFVRSHCSEKFLKQCLKEYGINRVWFTKEFTNNKVIKAAIELGIKVCLERTLSQAKKLSSFQQRTTRVYLTLGEVWFDFIKYGVPYREFVIEPTPIQTMTPEYFEDVKIK